MRDRSAPADAADSEYLRAQYDREMRNMIAIMCGFVFGRAAASMAFVAWLATRGGNPAALQGWRRLAEGSAMLVAALLLLCYVLPWVGRRSYNEKRQRRRTPERRRKERQAAMGVIGIAAAGVVVMAISAGSVPLMVIGPPVLSGVSAALLWAGSRWWMGDERRCIRCGYPLGDAPPERCPECGAPWLARWKSTLGRPSVNRPMIIAGCCVLALLALDVVMAFFVHPVL